MGGPEDLVFGDRCFLFKSADSQSFNAEGIDRPWSAAGILKDSIYGILIEQWFLQSCQFEVMLNIGGGFLFGQSRQVVLKGYPLVNGLKNRNQKSFPEMRLPDKYKQ